MEHADLEPVQVRFTLCLRDQGGMWSARWMRSLHGFLHSIKWTMFHGHLDYFQKPPLGGRPNAKPRDHVAPNAHKCCFILFDHMRGPTWIEIRWNCMWLRTRTHMPSHYTWRSVTTLRDFGSALDRPLGNFLWALTISWSWLLALVKQWLGRFLSITGWDPSVCKFNQLYVHILRFSFIKLGSIP